MSFQNVLKFLSKEDLDKLSTTSRGVREQVQSFRERVRKQEGNLEVIPIAPLQNVYKEFRLINPITQLFQDDKIQHLAVFNDDLMIFALHGNTSGFYMVQRYPEPQDPYKYRIRDKDPPLPPLVKEGNDGYTIMSHLVSPRSLFDFLDPKSLDRVRHVNKEFRDLVTTYAQRQDVRRERMDLQQYIPKSGLKVVDSNNRYETELDNKSYNMGYTVEVRSNPLHYRNDFMLPRIPKLFRVPVFFQGPYRLQRFASNHQGDFYAANLTSIYFLGRSNKYVAELIAGSDDYDPGNENGPATQARWTNIYGLSYCSKGLAILSTDSLNKESRVSFLDFSMSRMGTVRTLYQWKEKVLNTKLHGIAATDDKVYVTYMDPTKHTIWNFLPQEGIYSMQLVGDVNFTVEYAVDYKQESILHITSRNNIVYVVSTTTVHAVCILLPNKTLQRIATFPLRGRNGENVAPKSICIGANNAIYGLKDTPVTSRPTIFKIE